MVKPDERMELISAAILDQADRESREIIKKANAVRESELQKYREELTDRMYELIQRAVINIKLDATKRVAQYELQAHRALLARREELTASVFSAARLRLLEYAGTREYRDGLLDRVQRVKAQRPQLDHSGSVVGLREEDLALAGEIISVLGGGRAEKDPGIRLGGFTLLVPAAGLFIDETLDSRLREQKPWFLMHCGMKVI